MPPPSVKKKPSEITPSEISEKTVTEKEEILPFKKVKEGKEIKFENENYIVKFNSAGGIITDIGLKKHTRKNEEYFPIIENATFFLDYDKENQIIPGNYKYFSFEDKIEFEVILPENIKIRKIYKVPIKNHTFKTEIILRNLSKKEIVLKDYSINLINYEIPSRRRGTRNYYPPQILIGTEKGKKKITISNFKRDIKYEDVNWIALIAKYRMVFVELENPSRIFVHLKENKILVDYLSENFILNPDVMKKFEFTYYAGPSDYFIASKEVRRDVFSRNIFASLGRLLFLELYYIHKVIPNWGWAIIILTLIIKLLFFPLTRSGLRSMKKLQLLRPYLQDIQKKYKNNPQQMQRELMNIYREYKINPLGGCLPMFVQIPIFIGFFFALRNSIFLRGAPFLLWIKDLSLPDTIFKIGEFPVNVLPIIMTLTTYFQQKLTPTAEPSQKGLVILMPLIFLVLFYNFSSGLLLYWVTMNIAGLIEQYFIHRG